MALGHLRKKGVKKSYDTDSPAGISVEDLFMHAMIRAETGMGKSAYIRWLMAEILKSGYARATTSDTPMMWSEVRASRLGPGRHGPVDGQARARHRLQARSLTP